ncbi:acyl-CoA dehydrogenase family protein [Gordonia sp. (in: high G+C Gram-positive bacteria)]|jgi:alkylation response protein AidB-like acyl-CoA dehydrogenase|uniref:acyl-CoA dehydrogenase family protein n=1 Tax=Gordonia sp. (in: high G+C Gram-positive bacteria) TaxID=84139 RepID=UPI001DAAEA25|nr:acyl-CoA dehydrogenase family protein [Gordonia sp. (in: high G+C Gram-positive bacteria)]MCB1297309.1 acyl-CoA dehydrogenase family protein [Gordonia sp. (in: high G+C Gram-positive bacteria)]HMS74890.1 acyl-CoA dehydrogenase family protein [Gordonia sp. (in: high G+C Gram-positive bacteria)]
MDLSVDGVAGLPLSAADTAFRDEVRTWLAEHLVGEFAGQADRGGPDDDDNWELRRAWERELGAGNWLGLSWPVELGGRGATMTQEIIFAMEYARAGAPPRAAFHGETLMAPTALHYGTDEQKQRLLPPMARGEVVWCQGYSEPGAGSDLANVATRAYREGDDWVINGQKIWTTFAHHADWIFAIVRTEPGSVKHAGLSYMLIPLDQPGVTVRPIRTMLGDSGFNEVFFDDARTSADNVLGATGEGWRAAMTTLGHERATSVLNYQFSFVREMDHLTALARRRAPLEDPDIRHRIIHSYIGLQIMAYNNLRTLSAALRDGEFGPEASIGKYYWSRWHQDFTEIAMDVMGTDALLGTEWSSETGAPQRGSTDEATTLRRAFVRGRAETIYAGASEIQKNIIAERVLKLPKEARR